MASKIISLISTNYLFYLQIQCSSFRPYRNQSPSSELTHQGQALMFHFFAGKNRGPEEILAVLVQVRPIARAETPHRT